jgi:hypothetical protein
MSTFFLIPLSQALVSLRTESLRGRDYTPGSNLPQEETYVS